MRIVLIPILLLSILFLFSGCTKDEEVADLEQEVREAESEDYLADTTLAGEAATIAADTESAQEYAMTPEKALEEEKRAQMISPRPGEGFTVQVSAGTNHEYAKYLAGKFIERGYDAFVTEAVVDAQSFYRVRIGVFAGLNDAKTLGLELQDKYSVDFWIDNNR